MTIPSPELLTVATHKNWIAEEFAATNLIEVKQNFGLSAPLYPKEKSVAWWMPTETASRFQYAGINLNLLTVDAEWLSRVPENLTLRNIWTGTITEALYRGETGLAFCKPAEVKIPNAPAKWIEIDYFLSELLALSVPKDMKIQISNKFLDIKSEFRCFVNKGLVTTVATYLNNGNIFGGYDFERDAKMEELAKQYASEVIAVMKQDQPSSYVLDIGLLKTGEFFVIEGNPVWASNPYDCDKIEVVKAVIEGSTTYGDQYTHGKFQWGQDPYLKQYAETKAKLKIDDYTKEGAS